jgi:ParB family chromosome partitioning protein
MKSKKTRPADHASEARAAVGTKPDVQMLQVSALRAHPKQSKLVGDMRPAEFELLVADIKTNGIQNPLIILADGRTIVCGHQRHRAAVELGIEQVPCIVRQDLRDADDPAVLKLLLSDNLRRRQLGPLEKARYWIGCAPC